MNEIPKVLLIEDEEHIGNGIILNLKMEGYEARWAQTGEEGIQEWHQWNPHAIILDIMLPGINGLKVLQKIREQDKKTPILILSAKDEDQDRIKGLRMGGDDYLPKPFNLEELLIRVEKMIKRNSKVELETFLFGDFQINPGDFSAKNSQGDSLNLTPQEFKIIEILYLNKGTVVSRETLLTEALGYKGNVESRTIDNFIVRLRKYFENDPKKPLLIRSVRGAGYIH